MILIPINTKMVLNLESEKVNNRTPAVFPQKIATPISEPFQLRLENRSEVLGEEILHTEFLQAFDDRSRGDPKHVGGWNDKPNFMGILTEASLIYEWLCHIVLLFTDLLRMKQGKKHII